MSAHELKELLDQVPDTHELVLRRREPSNAHYDAWSDARDEAADALAEWRLHGGAARYAAYRAAQDREDAAQDTLAEA